MADEQAQVDWQVLESGPDGTRYADGGGMVVEMRVTYEPLPRGAGVTGAMAVSAAVAPPEGVVRS